MYIIAAIALLTPLHPISQILLNPLHQQKYIFEHHWTRFL
ncbi:hypothetical protein PL10110_470070 [Planktothrix agardhii]|nr:hypothetical protein PL10110_470070 [Planktothrix agardhii]